MTDPETRALPVDVAELCERLCETYCASLGAHQDRAFLTAAATALETLAAERDAARKIVRDIHWMARRYCDGRQSYAVGMFNDAVRPAFDAGWLTWQNDNEPKYARGGMFSPEWQSIEQRATKAEAEAKTLAAENARLRGAGQFLVDRLDDFDGAGDMDDEAGRQFYGHVTPALERFRAALSSVTQIKDSGRD